MIILSGNMKKKETINKSFNRKFRKAAMVLFIVLIGTIFTIPSILKSIYPTKSEIEIQSSIAAKLHKKPNELTKKDLAKIQVLTFDNDRELSDITFLKNLTNLIFLRLSYLKVPLNGIPQDTPKWKRLLYKLGIIDIPKKPYPPPWADFEKRVIDITPLKKLSKLEWLDLTGTWIKSISPVTCLVNLKELNLSYNNISDIEPLKKMKNLEMIDLTGCENITIEQIQDLQEALPELIINYDNYSPPW